MAYCNFSTFLSANDEGQTIETSALKLFMVLCDDCKLKFKLGWLVSGRVKLTHVFTSFEYVPVVILTG